jgi:hypothetical protein
VAVRGFGFERCPCRLATSRDDVNGSRAVPADPPAAPISRCGDLLLAHCDGLQSLLSACVVLERSLVVSRASFGVDVAHEEVRPVLSRSDHGALVVIRPRCLPAPEGVQQAVTRSPYPVSNLPR